MKAVEKTVKGKNYKLIIGTKETIALEKEIGANVMGDYLTYMIQMAKITELDGKEDISEDEMINTMKAMQDISTEYIAKIVYHALTKYDKKMTFDKALDWIDAFQEEAEHGKYDLFALVGEIFEASGFMKGMN